VSRKGPHRVGERRSTPRWTASIPGWPTPAALATAPLIGVLPGEGIGPEVVAAALTVLDAAGATSGVRFDVHTWQELGSPGRNGRRLAEPVADFCEKTFAAGGAVLAGAVGGRFVYELRARFDLYCKLVPLRPSPALADASIVRPERLRNVDLLVVRENVGDFYLGEFGRRDDGAAYQHGAYRPDQIDRIVSVAAALAARRRGRLAVIVKRGGIPEMSRLWMERTEAVTAQRADVAVETLDIDNASFQVVADPQRFDVVVAPNFMGDILADVATVLLGSRGMSFSANFGPSGRAVYQTGHGAAHDLVGSAAANPVGQILSLAMMLRESFGLSRAAARIEAAVERTLAAGFRTRDVAGPGSRVVGTRELAERIAAELDGPRLEAVEVS
jgi:3-isopropylmalate dehydrogenase